MYDPQSGQHAAPVSSTATAVAPPREAAEPERERRAPRERAEEPRRLPYALQVGLTTAPIAAVDAASLALSLALCTACAAGLGAPAALALGPLLLATPLAFLAAGLYPPLGLDPVWEVRRIGLAGALAFSALLARELVLGPIHLARPLTLGAAWMIAVPLAVWGRSVARSLCAYAPWWGLNAVVVGPDPHAAGAARALRENAAIGLRPVARLDELRPEPRTLHRSPRPHAELRRRKATWAVFAPGTDTPEQAAATIRRHFHSVPSLLLITRVLAHPTEARLRTVHCRGLTGVLVQTWLLRRTRHLVRRALSLAVALPVAIACLPLFALLALLVKLTSRGPVFYSQERIGAHGRRIHVWKFRTMVRDADRVLEEHLERHPELRAEWNRLHKLIDDPRVTSIGKVLRKTSLDELPQIWNVLRGDMCVVGPRPIVEAEIPKYGDAFGAYIQVAPGLTGLWQVSGRNATTYDKRVRLDAFYVHNWSLWLDLWVLARTVTVVLRRQGAH